MMVLLVALASPIDAGAQHLLWPHMLQHVLLAQVAAPCFFLAAPIATIDAALSRPWRRRFARLAARPAGRRARRLARQPLFAFGAMAAAWWGWHIPAAYDAAVRHAPLHAVEHLTLFATGLVWWNCVLGRH